MKCLIVFVAFIGVCVAFNSRQCSRLARMDCDKVDEEEKCDKEGNVYRNMCAFKKARCANTRLLPADCVKPTEGSGSGDKEKKIEFEIECKEKMAKDCTKEGGWKKICDNEGNEYANRCEFHKAQCANSQLRWRFCK